MHSAARLSAGMAQTMFPAMLAGVVGTALQLQQSALWAGPAYALIVVLAPVGLALAASKRIANIWRLLVVVAALAVFGFGVAGLRAVVYQADALDPALEGRDLLVTGVVAAMPQRNETGVRFRLEVESAQLLGQSTRVPPVMDVGWYGGAFPAGPMVALDADSNRAGESPVPVPVVVLGRQPGEVLAGERWQMTLRLKAPHGSRNPHGFDYELWLWEQGVQATAYVRASPQDPAPLLLGQTWHHPVALARQKVRERIERQIPDHQTAGMIAALVVGDQSAIDRSDWDVFRATGVAHLVSISGLHITMFAWGAALLLGWLWRYSGRLCLALPAPSAGLLGGVLLATAYAVFSGWGVPAQRTCLMLATVAVLHLSGARWPWPQVWMLACAVVVACDPWALLQPGFWLSFVAVGVLFASNSGAGSAHSTGATGLNDGQSSAGPPQGRLAPLGDSAALAKSASAVSGAVASVGAMLREQWVITVALTPLTLLLFGQVSIVGLAANALAIPWITLVVTPLAMLGVLVPVLWDWAGLAAGWLLIYLQWLAHWPWASIALAMPPLWAGVAGVMGGVVLVAPWGWSFRFMGLPLLLPVLLWRAPVPPPGEFELLAADVGQGNAVLVRTANHALLYDAGPRYSLESDAGHRVLVPLLQALHTQLDMVVLSHRDMDHVGGAPAVLTMQPQARLLSSIEASHPLQALRTAQACIAGQHWNWDGVEFAVLHPRAADYDTGAKSNAMSCVLRISNGRQTALLVGDIERAQEARLVADAGGRAAQDGAVEGTISLRANVLLVPHHGSKTSSSGEFLDAVAPELAVVQSGYRNRFGHPAPPVLARYVERKIGVVDSPHCGAFTWQSWHAEHSQGSACFRLQAQRYWHHRVP